MKVLLLVLVLLSSLPVALGWGQVGHATVATIAQSLLHPAVRSHLCTILPSFTSYQSNYPRKGAPHTHCHLATLASWPDTAKWRMPWSGKYHYINPIGDHPPSNCTYGEHGWTEQDNVLTSLVNYTRQLRDGQGAERDVALRFVTHFVGDLHQPLHLTGRQRGGNDVYVHWEGRKARLHSVWDSQMINTQLRTLANYTTPLPSLAFESALQGTIYDAYTRWIAAEGLGIAKSSTGPMEGWWEKEWQEWSHCSQDNKVVSDDATGHVDETDLPLCPMEWSRPMHPLVCRYGFASPVPVSDDEDDLTDEEDTLEHGEYFESSNNDDIEANRRRRRRRRPRPTPPRPTPGRPSPTPHPPMPICPELAVPEYQGRIDDDKVLQKQLAMAGVRLAAIVNSLLLEEALEAEQKRASMATVQTRPLCQTLWQDVRDAIRQRVVLAGF